MKKIITIIALAITFNATAQQAIEPVSKPIQNLSPTKKSKAGKTLLVMSGASFAVGSIIAFNSYTAKEPEAVWSPRMISNYNTKQKRARTVTAGLYGLGGLLLAVGAVITF